VRGPAPCSLLHVGGAVLTPLPRPPPSQVLGVLKRNTVANERAVEWRGPGLRFMSADARFAIANMTTEVS
jgi:hypothetical protein